MVVNQKVVTATYELYIKDENGKEELMEKATAEAPLVWCQGEGMMLPAFEAAMAGKEKGDTFDFVLK
ncbi:MAG: peptidylprolyl isomerase, partial [Paludibacteraceae bacterium]|nr:peptidylprolyl isomerase [Paludibacteraceae bacterium]